MRQRWPVIMGMLTVTVIAAVGLAVAGGVVLRQGPVPVVTPAATPARLNAAERAYYDAVAPSLRAAAAEARALTDQGEARSRNLFAIRAGQGRLQAHLAAIDAAVAVTPAPTRFAVGLAPYAPAAATVRRAMSAAEAAFPRFDWDAVGAATEQLAAATAELEAVSAALDAAAGVSSGPATPAAAGP